MNQLGLSNLYAEWEAEERHPMHLAAHGAAKLARVWQGCTWGRMERHFCTDEEDRIPDDDGEGISLEEMFKTLSDWRLPLVSK